MNMTIIIPQMPFSKANLVMKWNLFVQDRKEPWHLMRNESSLWQRKKYFNWSSLSTLQGLTQRPFLGIRITLNSNEFKLGSMSLCKNDVLNFKSCRTFECSRLAVLTTEIQQLPGVKFRSWSKYSQSSKEFQSLVFPQNLSHIEDRLWKSTTLPLN